MKKATPKKNKVKIGKNMYKFDSVVKKDGVINTRTKIGTSKDRSTSTYVQKNLEDRKYYEELYDIVPMAKKIVDILPKESTREWIDYTNLELNEKDKLLKEIKRLRIRDFIYKTAVYSRLYGAGCIYIFDDTSLEKLKTPLKEKTTIKNLILFNNFDLQPSFEKVLDFSSPSYGLPKYYKITSNINDKINTVEIHYSRFIIMQGDEISKTSFESNNYFNYGILGKIGDTIKNWTISYNLIPDIIAKYNLAILKMDGMVEVLESTMDENGDCIIGKQVIRDKVDQVNEDITSLSIGVIDSKDEFDIVNPTNSEGLASLLEKLDKLLIAESNIPHTRIMGESPGGSNSTGNSTTLDFENKIKQFQETRIRPALDTLFNIMKDYLNIGDFDFDFNPLYQPTEKEVAETRKITSDTYNADIASGILSAEEVRDSVYGGEKYSSNIVINGDIDNDLEESEDTKK